MTAPVTPANVAPRPGDLVFCHSKGVVGKAIRLGEWLRFRRGSAYNHVAIVNGQTPHGAWTVIQAEGRGVTSDGLLDDIAPGGFYEIVRLPDDVDANEVLHFAQAQIGRRYGFVTIASIVLSIILPTALHVLAPFTWICSALAGESLRFGGWYHPWPDERSVVPSQLWDALTAGGVQIVAKPSSVWSRLRAKLRQKAPGWIKSALKAFVETVLPILIQAAISAALATPKKAATKLARRKVNPYAPDGGNHPDAN